MWFAFKTTFPASPTTNENQIPVYQVGLKLRVWVWNHTPRKIQANLFAQGCDFQIRYKLSRISNVLSFIKDRLQWYHFNIIEVVPL